MQNSDLIYAAGGLLLFGGAVFVQARAAGIARRAWTLALFVLAFAIGTHRWPGFPSWPLVASQALASCSTPFRWTLHLDKALIACILLLGLGRVWRPPADSLRPARVAALAVLLPLGAAAVLGLGWLFDYVRWHPSAPAYAGVWLLAHLFAVVMPEEALFRGLLQRELDRAFASRRHGRGLALTAAALIFGLAHAGDGPVYALLAVAAGFFYGYLWQQGRSLLWPIAGHFLVNAAHFLWFTYPAWNGRPCL